MPHLDAGMYHSSWLGFVLGLWGIYFYMGQEVIGYFLLEEEFKVEGKEEVKEWKEELEWMIEWEIGEKGLEEIKVWEE